MEKCKVVISIYVDRTIIKISSKSYEEKLLLLNVLSLRNNIFEKTLQRVLENL